MKPQQEELLRRLALNDEAAAAAVLGMDLGAAQGSSLDARTIALARLAALVAVQAPRTSVHWAVDSAFALGVREEEVVDVLRAVAPIVGLARVTSAAPGLALAMGYDVDGLELS